MVPSQLEGDAGEPIIPLLRIIEARQYTRAVKQIEDHCKAEGAKAKDAPTGPMIDLVIEIQGERIRLAEEDDNR